ncbi:hypothetical protein LY28_03161 [Ruminiclostridium sufflavum DSM 19573]|uniref:Uncharacterized protein n=1 Tax=Ruminiclostridium sufflavum DSM 19573 TaxID=1121337 RepID=A0A318XTS5_9FIRM|nr:hypothetical protein [Ruminiclostridium sufflavum]PYG85742.1 hypothetical protein LY28_03161 [Ruminiclostridium sufflavum DSM 19573]
MKLHGRLVRQGKLIKEAWAESQDASGEFREQLEECLILLCKELDIEVPLWLKKNSKEFGIYRKTSFDSNHFGEAVSFDRFEIALY